MSILNYCEKAELGIQVAEETIDETDKPPNSYHVTYFDLGSLLYSIIFHFIDVGFDFYVAYSYFTTKRYSYFAWTMAFILLPSLILTLLSIRMYVVDSKNRASSKYSNTRIVLCLLGTILQLAPVIRNCDSLYCAIKSLKAESDSDTKQQRKYFMKMLNEDSDAALLRVFECYLESAPQQVLQITLLLVDYSHGSGVHTTKQFVSITLGFLAMGWCITNYNRCIRFDQENKQNISALGTTIQFFWHLNFSVSRILSIAAISTLYTFWTCIAVAIHWCVMTVWLAIVSKTTFCGKNKFLEIFFSSAVALVYIFNFINVKDGPTKSSYLFFYFLCFTENVIAASIWGVKSASLIKNWSYYVFIVFPVLCFLLSTVLLIVYYKFFHPSKLKSGFNNNGKSFVKEDAPHEAHEEKITFTHEHTN